MAGVAASVRSFGGIAATHELLSRGHSPDAILSAVERKDVVRVRKGWYANGDLGADVLQAWRVGGQLACISAARHRGLWVPEGTSEIHVSVTPNAAQLRTPNDHRRRLAVAEGVEARIHWTRARSGDRTAVSVEVAVQQAFHCQGEEVGFVILESALNLGRMRAAEFRGLLGRLPNTLRVSASRASGLSESGTESMMKLLLLERGIPFRQQVEVAGVGRVDFVVGDRLVIEVDSKLHHSDPYRDRRRDAELSVQGMRSLRFMYSQVVHERSHVDAAIVSALARSDHNRA